MDTLPNPSARPNPSTKALRSYYWWLSLSLIAYAIAIIFSRNFLHIHPGNGPVFFAIALLPLLPSIFGFVAIVRLVLATDELQRRIIVNSLALAGGATALLAVTYGLIEGDDIPNPSAWCTYVVFMVSWLIAGIFVRRHYK
jgi:hypothetical protein